MIRTPILSTPCSRRLLWKFASVHASRFRLRHGNGGQADRLDSAGNADTVFGYRRRGPSFPCGEERGL